MDKFITRTKIKRQRVEEQTPSEPETHSTPIPNVNSTSFDPKDINALVSDPSLRLNIFDFPLSEIENRKYTASIPSKGTLSTERKRLYIPSEIYMQIKTTIYCPNSLIYFLIGWSIANRKMLHIVCLVTCLNLVPRKVGVILLLARGLKTGKRKKHCMSTSEALTVLTINA
jgi:hypothetical protein